ncbi:hypothetical protein SLEP1_g15096 [Rubroshorea leprosula]|uniref:Uncharacterized protein n=1 Tax=Rubroshorea leprosula TaxID=152421 RepID=A0AAV5IWR1_9ROSI|nr:hypothetical protein SLEP1_g15096 [Rubroshorea leprosula]
MDKTGTTEPTNLDPETVVKSSRTEIQHLCETMFNKGLRRYIATHLFDILKLRESTCGSKAHLKAGKTGFALHWEVFSAGQVDIEQGLKEEAEMDGSNCMEEEVD